jgi:hypothetical protein
VLVGTGLWFIGVPHPVLWGILGILLRFVPYIGPVIAAALPLIVALAVDPGWAMLLWAMALFLVVELAIGQVIEPWLYGHSTGLSGIAVVVAAAFWTLLWGPVGLLLSTPLTMCLVVLGRHVERLQFLEVLLGDQPALAPEETFYQRMLAGDPDEAAHQAEEFLKAEPLSAYYDEVAIGGLTLAQFDVNRGALGHEHRVRIKEAVDGLIDNLADHDPGSVQKEGDSSGAVIPVFTPEELPRPWAGNRRIMRCRPWIARRGICGNAGTASAKTRHWCACGAVRSRFGTEPVQARRDRRADGVSLLS